MKLNLFEKILVGVYSIKIGKKYLIFNKMGPYMCTMIALTGLTQQDSLWDIPVLFWVGLVGVAIGFVAFFYFTIFPSRKPKTEEDYKKFFTVINDKKS